jgi:YD repeat-containing protein
MTRALIIVLALAASPVAAQQTQTLYGPDGRVVSRSQTFKSGDTTFFDAAGRVTGRSQTSGGETRYYDAAGRLIGTVRKPCAAPSSPWRACWPRAHRHPPAPPAAAWMAGSATLATIKGRARIKGHGALHA